MRRMLVIRRVHRSRSGRSRGPPPAGRRLFGVAAPATRTAAFALSAGAPRAASRATSTTRSGAPVARGDGVLAAVTVPLGREVDPTAVAAASRRAGEPWFCLEQPERDRAALAALGCAAALEAGGPDRFTAVARRWRALAANAACDAPDGPRGGGPVAVGGFAFAPEGGRAPHWAGFPAASLHVPRSRSRAAARTCA